MDNQIAQFIDSYADPDQHISTELESANDFHMQSDDTDELTSWETFCREADAWARHAQASNGFGGL